MEPFGIIYLVTNRVTGMYYIGQTVQTWAVRWSEHRSNAKRKSPLHFHRALAKYGIESFDYETVAEASSMDELNHLESLWIILTGSYLPKVGYNGTYGGGNKLATPETKAKMSKAQMGKTFSPETRALMSAAKKGKPGNPVAIEAMRKTTIGNQWNVGKTQSAEHRAKRSASMKGKKNSPEHIEKVRQIHIGNTYWLGKSHSMESRQKVSAARMGIKFSEDHCRNLSAARKGRPWTEARRLAQAKRKATL